MPTLPHTAPAAVMSGPGEITIRDIPVDRPADNEVLIEILSVGVCGSDIHWFKEGRIGDTLVEAPLVLGHEASGRIAAVGSNVDSNRLGQRVALEPGIPCRHCEQCKQGRYNLCPSVEFFATPPVDGVFRRFITIPADFAHPVPESLSDDEAALIEPLSVAVWAVQKSGLKLGESVLITGAGAVGLLCAQVALIAGAADVTVTDITNERLDAAASFGATRTINTREERAADCVAADVLIECSGSAAATRDGLAALRRAGRAVLVGMSATPDLTLPLDLIQQREVTVTGTFRYANTYPAAIRLAALGAINLGALVTSHHHLEDTLGALNAAAGNPRAIKAIVRPQSPSIQEPRPLGDATHANNR